MRPTRRLRQATVEIGNVTVNREQVRASGWEHGIETLITDARYALRRLRRPVFTLVASLTLASGSAPRGNLQRGQPDSLSRAAYPGANASSRLAIAHNRAQQPSRRMGLTRNSPFAAGRRRR